ncbi:MAG: hypothetical protein H6727_07275 [Myxococcales bacterium]|nr:hypothetical protein [Myxococcales bacterium]
MCYLGFYLNELLVSYCGEHLQILIAPPAKVIEAFVRNRIKKACLKASSVIVR